MIGGRQILQDVRQFDTSAGAAGLWWLGQHSFILKAAGKVVYIDPFLAPMPDRRVPPLLAPADLGDADFVCGTHDHADHIDRDSWPAIARHAPAAKFVVPQVLRERLARDLAIPPGRFVGIDAGQTLTLAPGLSVSAVAAAHELLDPDPVTGQFAFLGYVFRAGRATVYHAGDTCWYDGLQTTLRAWTFDAMLVPINGRDAERLAANIIGNMTYQEAADLCGPLRPRLVIPTHWDMFAANPGDPHAFLRYMKAKYPDVPATIADYGRRITLSAG